MAMKFKTEYEFTRAKDGLIGCRVRIALYARKHWWNKWVKVSSRTAECNGYNPWPCNGAAWTYLGDGKMMDGKTEREINEAYDARFSSEE
ncbi:hypothetical protein ACCY75_01275 [Enterobacter kobei]|uniref:hypothetical protein n=1 Tax=Enterobacter kobei TaxID=208224 RepID=UPI003ED8931B